ncbi:hypothetical protein [Halorubrum sp. CGM4_25_10-8A]|uniref:hypothetical protein n=1 Tax=Halorubrum sp. CGM4_25_10-8A TaxID=2518116 RepID=UPI0010F9D152|nr:hypothetical protein [Halorubrum sp. CGM4_25_10-8A]TKX36657.1 hypothetical protein EXE52_16435 [Halorubrum sp. CGM4_25_10-8A]
MAGVQAIFLAICFPVLVIGLHELTHLAVARITCPISIEHTSWVPLRLRLDFERVPAKATLRMIALAPLFVGSVTAVIAIQTGIWQQIKTADPYYLHHLMIAYWLLYIVPSPADIRLAIWPSAEDTQRVQVNPQ